MNLSSIKKKTSTSLFATINLGLFTNYSDLLISKADVYTTIQAYQKELKKTTGILLSVSIVECDIVMGGQIEPHLKLNFINYPLSPLDEKTFQNCIEDLAKVLMSTFDQNRVVIEYPKKTIMLEKSDEIDPRILTN